MTQTQTVRSRKAQSEKAQSQEARGGQAATGNQVDEPEQVPYANEVRLCGRVAAVPVVRVMPSGDEMTTFRVIVRRPPAALRKSKVTVDSVECVAWTAATRRSASRLEPGDVVEVTGALRRRFQRSGDGPVSRVDVEVDRCRRVPVPGRRRRASPSDA